MLEKDIEADTAEGCQTEAEIVPIDPFDPQRGRSTVVREESNSADDESDERTCRNDSRSKSRSRSQKGFRNELRRITLHFTPSWFSVNMGTGITSILLHELPYQFKDYVLLQTSSLD